MTIKHILLCCAAAFLTGAYVLWRDGMDWAILAMMAFTASIFTYELDQSQ